MGHARNEPERPADLDVADIERDAGADIGDKAVHDILNRDDGPEGDDPVRGIANGLVLGAAIWAILVLVFLLLR